MISFNNVCKKYSNYKVLNGLSLKIENDDVCIINGTNGSGKSTTINLIVGLYKLNKNDSGEIINDFNTISYFPERFVLPSLVSSKDFLGTFYYESLGTNKLDEYLELYQIPNKKIASLSKGMQQKLLLVKTILKFAELYIFDEPLNGLDNEAKKQFMKDLKVLKKNKRTIIIVSHDPDFFNPIATKKIFMNNGIGYEKN